MLNWDDHVTLSKRDLTEARRIVLAPFVAEIARVARTLEILESLSDTPERCQLIAKALALRAKWLALKNEREAILDRAIPRQIGFVKLRVADLTSALGRVEAIITRLHERPPYCELAFWFVSGVLSSKQGHALAEERRRSLRHTGRRLFFVARLSRQVAVRARASLGRQASVLSVRPVCSRSAASRSRIVAPTAAPPAEC